jgi:hypothetical protein
MLECARNDAPPYFIWSVTRYRAKVTDKYDEETKSYTNDVEVLSGKIADLTKTAATPGGISLFTDETKTEYKSTYQLLEEISEIYDDLTDKQQAKLCLYVQKCA